MKTPLIRPCPACGRHTLVRHRYGSIFCASERCRHNWEQVKLKDSVDTQSQSM